MSGCMTRPRTWIICPNLRGARLFLHEDDMPLPRFVRELPRPSHQVRDEDFDGDADVPEVFSDPKALREDTEVAEEYALFIAQYLKEHMERYERLVLCAEPRLLGILRGALHRSVRKKLSGEVEVDLYHVNETDLENYWRDLKLNPHQPPAA